MENRKKQIIELSIELVKKYGYDSFSYATLSKELGITKASIHHHFQRKDDLGLELCSYIHAHMVKEFNSILSKKNCAKEKMKDYLNLYAKMIETGDKICPIASLQAEANVISKEMREEVCLIDDAENDFIETVLNLGIKENDFYIKGDIKLEALLITSALKGALQYSRIHDKNKYMLIAEQLTLRLQSF